MIEKSKLGGLITAFLLRTRASKSLRAEMVRLEAEAKRASGLVLDRLRKDMSDISNELGNRHQKQIRKEATT